MEPDMKLIFADTCMEVLQCFCETKGLVRAGVMTLWLQSTDTDNKIREIMVSANCDVDDGRLLVFKERARQLADVQRDEFAHGAPVWKPNRAQSRCLVVVPKGVFWAELPLSNSKRRKNYRPDEGRPEGLANLRGDRKRRLAELWGTRTFDLALRMIAFRPEVSSTACDRLRELANNEEETFLGLLKQHCMPRSASTREKYVRTFEKFEEWALGNDRVPYAPAEVDVEGYVRKKIMEGCGVSVPTSICQAIWHFCGLFGWPDCTDSETLKVSMRTHQDAHERPIKKAAAYSPLICAGLEDVVCDIKEAKHCRFRAWVERLRIGGSMRWDDAQCTPTWSVTLIEHGVYSRPENTKTTRPMDGVSWVASAEHFRRSDWLKTGWDLAQQDPEIGFPRDCLLPALNMNRDGFVAEYGSYDEHVSEMRAIITRLLVSAGSTPSQAAVESSWYSGHSAKPTLISIATLAQEDPTAVRLQGGWKDPAGATPMQFEYSRDSMAVPLNMTTRLIKALRLGQIDVARMAAIDVLSVGGGQRPFHDGGLIVKPAARNHHSIKRK